MNTTSDIIVAPATLTGGAIAIIRLSGEGSIALCDTIFNPAKRSLSSAATHTLHYGEIVDGTRIIDDVLISIFRAPHSYTGEESVEISCHGSHYIVQEIIELLIKGGAHAATAGEFTTRAYLAGRIDLSQAEAVADMIASSSKAQHAMASTQMRGGYSQRLNELRQQLVELAALLELELDFSEEEVEFADRSRLTTLMSSLNSEIEKLSNSFSVGNAIKRGVPVAIIGEPNVGKSTLLNTLLNDQRAMVSDIAGTTRDLIEEEITLDGILFRFIDTAGVHATSDQLELMGIERTHQAIEKAQIIIHLLDAQTANSRQSEIDLSKLRKDQKVITAINKVDLSKEPQTNTNALPISAKNNQGIEELTTLLRQQIDTQSLFEGAPIVSNTRHYELLTQAQKSLQTAHSGLKENLPTDLLCQDIREVLHHIGSITGSITTNEILAEVFSKFCIGK
ncbi:MAG: tRNA uridine-5-carboxymethylaminomethyl(34) synthesis GTPase MnmE [Rikenellaceae bacterium]